MVTKRSLLVDEEAARQFRRSYLIPYRKPRILQCVGRKKYSEGFMKTGTVICERTVLRFDGEQESEDAFIRELVKMDILANAGFFVEPSKCKKLAPTSIKPEWMVPYVTAFCLDEDDAADAFVANVMETRRDQRKALEKQKLASSAPSMVNVMSKMQTLLHQHPHKEHRWLKLDVDTKDVELIKQLQEILKGASIIVAVESRGGYHVVLEKGPCCQSLYKFAIVVNRGVQKEDQWITIENTTGPLLAIPGTNQGGFVVRCATEMWKQGII